MVIEGRKRFVISWRCVSPSPSRARWRARRGGGTNAAWSTHPTFAPATFALVELFVVPGIIAAITTVLTPRIAAFFTSNGPAEQPNRC
jgi:hypothetical protein